jgi:hypothetical protein
MGQPQEIARPMGRIPSVAASEVGPSPVEAGGRDRRRALAFVRAAPAGPARSRG